MKQTFILLATFLLFLCSAGASAQKQANIWYLGQKGLDFNYNPPQVLTDGAMSVSEGNATIADANGNLLFYSNGESIWNKRHEVMANGTGLAGNISSRQGVMIVPRPGSKTLYFVFTTDALEKQYTQGLRYSVVDMGRQNGLGEVIQKNVLLQPLAEENLTATGSCSCPGTGTYWLAADRHDQPGFLYAYRITEAGVEQQPVISFLPSVANISYLKFSPKGEKIAFTGLDEANRPIIGLADFDRVTGKFSHFQLLPGYSNDYHRGIEFSSDSRFLYYSTFNGIPRLIQFDLSGKTAQEIQSTAVMLADQSHPSFIPLQLAPDGNIYTGVSTTSSPVRKFISVILNSNHSYTAATFKAEQVMELPNFIYVLPNFVTTFLYHNDTLTMNLEAGPDRRVCRDEAIQLGGRSSSQIRYNWSPGAFLSDSTAPNPIFRYTGSAAQDTTIRYILTASDGPCSRRDTVLVTVSPLPETAITGSRSVCPRVEGVAYQVALQEGHTYRWRASGGAISSGQGTAAITVDWGLSNADAWVEVVPISKYGCEGPAARLPVRINVELDTETPQGPEEVCLNLRQNNRYQVTNTNGSVYTWGAEGGTITAGQGSAQITIDWSGEGRHRLWLQERSITRDTVCFGTSDTLSVRVFQDNTSLNMHYVSISLSDDQQVEAYWSASDPGRLSAPLTLNRRIRGAADWLPAAAVPPQATTATDTGPDIDKQVYAYSVEGLNGCGELIRSEVHNTVRLTGQTDDATKQISLVWNPYEGWQQGVERYEVWRQLDQEPEPKLLGQVTGSEFRFSGLSSLDGFSHRFRIRAIARGTSYASWSNELELAFPHALTVPNIFTPNGDGLNDAFVIPLLELYPENRLTVFNRWGQQVYTVQGYQNSWTGQGLNSGTYFYHLQLHKTGAQLKGWVEIVR